GGQRAQRICQPAGEFFPDGPHQPAPGRVRNSQDDGTNQDLVERDRRQRPRRRQDAGAHDGSLHDDSRNYYRRGAWRDSNLVGSVTHVYADQAPGTPDELETAAVLPAADHFGDSPPRL